MRPADADPAWMLAIPVLLGLALCAVLAAIVRRASRAPDADAEPEPLGDVTNWRLP